MSGGILHMLGMVAEIALGLAAVVWVALRCVQRLAVEGWIDENGTERIGVRPEEMDRALAHPDYWPAAREGETNSNGDGMDSDHAARLTPPVHNSRAGGVLFRPTVQLLEGPVSFPIAHHDHSTSPQEPQHHGEC